MYCLCLHILTFLLKGQDMPEPSNLQILKFPSCFRKPPTSRQRCPAWTLAAVSATPAVCWSFANSGSQTSFEESEKRSKAATVAGRTNGNAGPLNS